MRDFETPLEYAQHLVEKFNVDYLCDGAQDPIEATHHIVKGVIDELYNSEESSYWSAFLMSTKEEIKNTKFK